MCLRFGVVTSFFFVWFSGRNAIMLLRVKEFLFFDWEWYVSGPKTLTMANSFFFISLINKFIQFNQQRIFAQIFLNKKLQLQVLGKKKNQFTMFTWFGWFQEKISIDYPMKFTLFGDSVYRWIYFQSENCAVDDLYVIQAQRTKTNWLPWMYHRMMFRYCIGWLCCFWFFLHIHTMKKRRKNASTETYLRQTHECAYGNCMRYSFRLEWNGSGRMRTRSLSNWLTQVCDERRCAETENDKHRSRIVQWCSIASMYS